MKFLRRTSVTDVDAFRRDGCRIAGVSGAVRECEARAAPRNYTQPPADCGDSGTPASRRGVLGRPGGTPVDGRLAAILRTEPTQARARLADVTARGGYRADRGSAFHSPQRSRAADSDSRIGRPSHALVNAQAVKPN